MKSKQKDTIAELQENLRKFTGGTAEMPKKEKTTAQDIATVPEKKMAKQRVKEHAIFKIWLGIPRQLLGQNVEQLHRMGIISEPHSILCEIRTMTAFAQRFKVDMKTLYNWHKEIGNEPEVIFAFRKEGQELTKNFIMALYAQGMKEMTPELFKTWMWIVHGETQKTEVAQTTQHWDVVGFMREMKKEAEDEQKQLAAKKKKDHEQDD